MGRSSKNERFGSPIIVCFFFWGDDADRGWSLVGHFLLGEEERKEPRSV